MKVRPLVDRVLVKISSETSETKTQGGIYIPETAQEKTQDGVVVAVGPSEDIKVKEGDRVIYDKFAGTPIKIEAEDHLILKAKEIHAVIE